MTVWINLRRGSRKRDKFRETLRPVWDPVGGRSLGDIKGKVSRVRRESRTREREVGMIHTLAPNQGSLLESQLPPALHPHPVSPLSHVSWSLQEVSGLAKHVPKCPSRL